METCPASPPSLQTSSAPWPAVLPPFLHLPPSCSPSPSSSCLLLPQQQLPSLHTRSLVSLFPSALPAGVRSLSGALALSPTPAASSLQSSYISPPTPAVAARHPPLLPPPGPGLGLRCLSPPRIPNSALPGSRRVLYIEGQEGGGLVRKKSRVRHVVWLIQSKAEHTCPSLPPCHLSSLPPYLPRTCTSVQFFVRPGRFLSQHTCAMLNGVKLRPEGSMLLL